MKFWDIEPHMELLQNREPNGAYLACKPGAAYVLSLCKGGSVGLDLTGVAEPLRLRWIDINTGEWAGAGELPGGALRAIQAPGDGPWVAGVTRP